MPSNPPTVLHALHTAAERHGDLRGLRFLLDDDREDFLGFARLTAESAASGEALRAAGVREGEPVPVLLPTGPDFARVFLGLWTIGAVPVPLPGPANFSGAEEFQERLGRLVAYLNARRIVAPARLGQALAGLGDGITFFDPEAPGGTGPGCASGTASTTRATRGSNATGSAAAAAKPEDLALIQCTSGSTGHPKGAAISHSNLAANLEQIAAGMDCGPDEVVVSWLPMFHDMGLIGCLLFAIHQGFDGVFLTPFRFLRRPASWLRAVSRFQGTLSPAPNFAYRYVQDRARPAELEGLDLSSWRVALCGAEPIDAEILRSFEARYAPLGLRENVLMPCYGLAEATLAVSFAAWGRDLAVDRLRRDALGDEGIARDADPRDPTAMNVVDCGRPLPGTRLRIVDESGATLPEDRVGRVQVAGPTVMRGYYGLPEASAEALPGGWLDTGDLGYLRGGGLRIVGRVKDLIIIRGQNHAPSDFEWAAEAVAGVGRGKAVALGVRDESAGTECLHLLVESELEDEGARRALAAAVSASVTARTAVVPAAVRLVPKRFILKTTSGKTRRAATKERYLERGDSWPS